MARDPFGQVRLTVDYVDSAAGSRKTLTAIAVSLDRAKRGSKVLIAMPTLELVREMVEFARRDTTVPVVEITTRDDGTGPSRYSIPQLLCRHISGRDAKGKPIDGHIRDGHLLFVTHEALNRMLDWPDETEQWELLIDEAPEVILTRQPFKLRDSGYVLTSFLTTRPAPATLALRRARDKAEAEGKVVFTDRDARWLEHMEALLKKSSGASDGERAQAEEQRNRLLQKKLVAEGEAGDAPMVPYYVVEPKDADWLKRRIYAAALDDIYGYIAPVPSWLAQGASLFVDMTAWNRMVDRTDNRPDRGRVTISGFRRPDPLARFKRVTIMSALFEHTLVHQVWKALGVRFQESDLIRLSVPTTPLGSRRLKIYWLTAEGWSKRTRDRAGGIGAILGLIASAGVINPGEGVCCVVNKDDGSEEDPGKVREHFRNAVMMPHNSRGQNRFRHHHQLIHCAALNGYTSDIRWLEQCLGIDSPTQRIARTGCEIYQTLMRLSLRDPTATADVRLVVMDRVVADWLVQWFTPAGQVEVIEIDSSSVIKPKGKGGRPRVGDHPMTAAERQRRRRERLRLAA